MMGVVRVGDHRRVAMHRSALLGRRPGSGRFYGREQTRVTTTTTVYPQLEVVHSRDISSGRMNDEITLHVYDSNQSAEKHGTEH